MPDTPPPPTVDPTALTEVADSVFVIGDRRVPLVPNVGIVLGSDAALIVDTGMGPANGARGARGCAQTRGRETAHPDAHPLPPGARLRAQAFTGQATILYNRPA